MLKTTKIYNQIHYDTNDSLTPIRDYDHDFFHSQDNKLPKFSNISRLGSLRTVKTLKRPVSLDLTEIAEPLPKRLNSPLNLDKFRSIVNIKNDEYDEDNDSSKDSFFSILEALYDSEAEYASTMNFANSVYRRVLRENSKFAMKLIKLNSNDELLLFGNIDTICSISRIFLNLLKKELMPNLQLNESLNWNYLKTTNTKIEFDIASVIEQHIFRCKSTYMSYAVAHSKQMKLFENIRENKGPLFQKWYEHCLKDAHFRTLEDILKYPIIRIQNLVVIMEDLRKAGSEILSETAFLKLSKVTDGLLKFKRGLDMEMLEFSGNETFDFSLTPGEIIQSYDDNRLKLHEEPVDDTSLPIIPVLKERTTSKLTEIYSRYSKFSESSSYYSDGSSINSDTKALHVLSPLEESPTEQLNLPMEQEKLSYSLPDNIMKFKRIFKNLVRLKLLIHKLELFSSLDERLKNLNLWKCILEMDPMAKLNTDYNEFTLCSVYEQIENIKTMKEKVTVLRLTEIEVGVLIPLTTMIRNCERVKGQLRDLKTLKKDYIIYLKEKRTNVHDVKRDVIGKHYEALQDCLTRQLPLFINLVHQVTERVILNYNKILLQYFEILSGDKAKLQKDMKCKEKSSNNGQASNFDILQTYSTSRYHLKRVVRNNWDFSKDATTSKVVRRLFEL